VKGSWVVAWVCGIPANPTAAVVKANVPTTSCEKVLTGTTKGKYESCFNKMMLDAINTKRRDHIVEDLTLKEDHAVQLEDLVRKSSQKWTDPKTRPTDV